MRDIRSQDYWKDAYKRSYTDNFLEIDFNGLNNLPSMTFPTGLLALCGLNGAGKSTIVSAIKDLIGIRLSEQDMHKVGSHAINGKATFSESEINCANRTGERLVDNGWEIDKVKYLDCIESTTIQNFIINQMNLEELLEQYEEYELPETDIKDINYLVGKKYNRCTVRELNDIDGQDSVFPYFTVEVDGIKYDTKSMGYGEHFLLYLFWCINQIDKGTLLIIEEPETYVSISSQIHFINYLGKQMACKGVKVILTTHSPYILGSIRNESIRVVSRMGNKVSIITPDESFSAEALLGIAAKSIGTFFVEDRVASDFLIAILEDRLPHLLREFTIDIVGGESEITNRLMFPYSERINYKFIGVYDGNMRNSLNSSKLQWKYCFLPGEKAIEEVCRDLLHKPKNIEKLCEYLTKDVGQVVAILSKIDGLDCHDWFNEFRKLLSVGGRTLVMAFYQTMLKDTLEVDRFVSEVYETTKS